MGKQAKTYRLPDSTVDRIAEIARREHCSATQAIIKAVDRYCTNGEPSSSTTEVESWWLDFLTDQLSAKDKQIMNLLRLMSQSQEIMRQLIKQNERLLEIGKGKPSKHGKH